MGFAEIKKSESLANRYVFRVASIEGSTVKTLWEGHSLGDGEIEQEKAATAARLRGSNETIVLDGFRIDIERQWVQRFITSRPPSSLSSGRRVGGIRGRPRILFMPAEFPSWNAGAHSWSYGAQLAYERGLRAAGCEVTTINTACAPYHAKILKGQRFDQVWLHCHARHIDDFAFRTWIAEVAPVRLLLCGETVRYQEHEVEAQPWFAAHTGAYERWEPFITHAAFVDPADVAKAKKPAMWWRQAVPERFVLTVNTRPRTRAAVFCGTLYPPRDRWVFELGALLEKVESPESDAFRWLFETSHEWVQQVLDRGPWWWRHGFGLYNRLQVGLRRYAFRNFLDVIREGVAIVNLPSMVKTDSGRVVEGMAAGRPVLSPHLPSPIFENGKEILRYGSPEELGALIRMLQLSPSYAAGLAGNARHTILSGHTVEKRTLELLRFVEAGP